MIKCKDILKKYRNEMMEYRSFVSSDDKKKVITGLKVMFVVLIIASLCFAFNQESTFVLYFTEGKIGLYIYEITFLYIASCILSWILVYIASSKFENRIVIIMLVINSLWYFSNQVLIWIYKKCGINALYKYTLNIFASHICSFLIAFYFMKFILFVLQTEKIEGYVFYNNYVIASTYIYFILFFSILIANEVFKKLLYIQLKIFKVQSEEIEKINKSNKRLNNYFLVILTLILNALNFEGSEKVLVEAFFYTNTAISLINLLKEKES